MRRIWILALPAALVAIGLFGAAILWIYQGISALNTRYQSEEKLRLYQTLAEKGNPDAQFELGVMYKSGFGTPQDVAKGLFWYRKAAEQRSARAERNLGIAYYNGEGVERDFAQAANWFRRAAEDGDRYSQHNIGRMYAQGVGVEKDKTRARYWFEQEVMGDRERLLVEKLYLQD
jgi:TPR repeat protein